MRMRCCLLFLSLLGLTAAEAAPVAPPAAYVRVVKDSAGEAQAFETAVVHCQSRSGPPVSVDLVAAVHFGEPGYYKSLNQRFKGYDAVLFEMVAPEDPADPGRLGRWLRLQQAIRVRHPEREADNPLSRIQVQLAKLLGMAFQLDAVDYGPANFVHADVTPDELAKSIRDRGESLQQVLLRALKSSLEQAGDVDQPELDDFTLLRILLRGPSPRDRILMRRMLAVSFKDIKRMNEILEGPGGGTLIAVRNRRVIKVLQAQLKRGRHHLAIFYGAAHMPDLEQQLESKLHLVCTGVRWVKAWNLSVRGLS